MGDREGEEERMEGEQGLLKLHACTSE